MYFDRILVLCVKIFFVVFIIGIVAFFIDELVLNTVGASQGEHTGFVTAVEYNTNIIWGANIVYFKTDTESTQEDKYCVNDETIKAQLESYAKSKSRVTIEYKNPFWVWKSLCNGGESIIIKVDESK
jgi:hypothetical protein